MGIEFLFSKLKICRNNIKAPKAQRTLQNWYL